MDIQCALELYLASLSSRNIRLTTQRMYASDIRQFIDYCNYSTTDDINYDSIRNWQAWLKDLQQLDTTREKKRVVIITFLHWLHDEGHIDMPDLSRKIRPGKVDAKRAAHLTQDEIRRLLEAAETLDYSSQFCRLRDIALLRVMCDTGLRRGEVLNMTLDKLDLWHRRILIGVESKGRKERIVGFTPETLRALRGYLRVRQSDTQAVWITIYGDAISEIIIRKALKRATKAAGLQNVHPHTLRHSFATKAIQAGIPVTSVQTLMGHMRVTTTMGYVHEIEEQALADYEKLFLN